MSLIGKSVIFKTDEVKIPTWAVVEESYLANENQVSVTKLIVRDKTTDILYHIFPADVQLIESNPN